MRKITLLLILSIIVQYASFSQNVTIKGNAKDYRGMVLSFYSTQDHLIRTEQELVKFEPDTEGNFSVNFPVATPRCIEIRLGVFIGKLFVEPKQEYEIVLPARVDKGKAEKYNPFFQAEEFFLGILNHDNKELHSQIVQLEDSINIHINRGLHVLVRTANRKLTERILARIHTGFSNYDNAYFQAYKYYRFEQIRYMIYARNDLRMLQKHYVGKSLQLNLPPYVEFFEQLAQDGLSRSANGRKWSAYNVIEKGASIHELRDSLAHFNQFEKGEFLDYYLLQGLYDAAYNRDFPKKKVIKLIEELAKTTSSSDLKVAASSVAEKASYLMEGQFAPDLKLVNSEGKVVHLSDFSGKFVYLNFGALWSTPFRRELKLLKKMHDQNIKDFEIITVSFDEDFQKVLDHSKREGYNWPFLHFDFNEEIAKTYKIRVYPTYYLIDPKGILVQSPAISIAENFGTFFLETYNQWRREKLKAKQGLRSSVLGQK